MPRTTNDPLSRGNGQCQAESPAVKQQTSHGVTEQGIVTNIRTMIDTRVDTEQEQDMERERKDYKWVDKQNA